MSEQNCANCKYSEPKCGALCCMGQKYAPYVRPTDSCDGWKSAKQTNADRIRAMSDEELATLLRSHTCPHPCEHEEDEFPCHICWLDWLKQEVEE